jgi:hypothetical protein
VSHMPETNSLREVEEFFIKRLGGSDTRDRGS